MTTTMIGDSAALNRLAAAVSQLAPHRLPIYRAVADGRIALVEPSRRTSVPSRMLIASNRPTILLIGDDDDAPTGPTGWCCARRAKKWGRSALIHAAAGEPAHYRAAVLGAEFHDRFVLVETDTAHRDAWASWLHSVMPGVVITTRPGDVHPRAASGGTLQ